MKIKKTQRIYISILFFFLSAILFGVCGFSALSIKGKYTPQMSIPDDSYSFVFSKGDELSHIMLWHNLRNHIDHAKAADVLIVGNSRTQYGFLDSVLIPPLERLGLKVFWLSTGHAERYPFFYKLFKKYSFSKKIIILQDTTLTQDVYSGPANIALQNTKWDGIKRYYEAVLSWNLERYIHRVIPKIEPSTLWYGPNVIYRSIHTGKWYDCRQNFNEGKYPISTKQCALKVTPGALSFLSYIRKNNRVIIISTPNSENSTSVAARIFAEKQGLEYISPTSTLLYTFDKSHLHPDSAKLYSENFVAKLNTLISKTKQKGKEASFPLHTSFRSKGECLN